MSLSDDKQADIIDAFGAISGHLDDILNINNVYFDHVISRCAFQSSSIVSTKIYDKRDAFDFEMSQFPNLDGDVPRSTSYGVYISQLIRFARASCHVADFNTRNKL